MSFWKKVVDFWTGTKTINLNCWDVTKQTI